jgi:hypothetical protein
MRVVVDVVEFVKLLVVLEDDAEDGVCFGELVELVESLGVEDQGLDHHLLGEDHHDQILETAADDHVADGRADELLIEPFLCLLADEEAVALRGLVDQLDPDDHIVDLVDVLQLVVGTDLVDLVELGLHDLLVERSFEEGLRVLFPVPGRHERCIFHL